MVKYGVPYFIVRVMAIGMLFLILNTSNILAATESPVVLDFISESDYFRTSVP